MAVTFIHVPAASVIEGLPQYLAAIMVPCFRIDKACAYIIPVSSSDNMSCTSYRLLLHSTPFIIFFPVKIEVVKLNQIPEGKAVPYLYRKVCHIMSCIDARKSLNGYHRFLRPIEHPHHRRRMFIFCSGYMDNIRVSLFYYIF